MKKKPLSKHARSERRRMQRDPFGRVSLAVQAFLEARGWRVLLTSNPRVLHQPLAAKCNYEFVVNFVGGKVEEGAAPAPETPRETNFKRRRGIETHRTGSIKPSSTR